MRFYPKESNKKVNSNYIPPASVKQRLVDANKLEESVKITDKPAWMVVRDAPTVDAVEVVHGEWIYDHWCEFKCSNCGHWSDSKPYKGRENYCPNCGAKMDKRS